MTEPTPEQRFSGIKGAIINANKSANRIEFDGPNFQTEVTDLASRLELIAGHLRTLAKDTSA